MDFDTSDLDQEYIYFPLDDCFQFNSEYQTTSFCLPENNTLLNFRGLPLEFTLERGTELRVTNPSGEDLTEFEDKLSEELNVLFSDKVKLSFGMSNPVVY